jgi:hypothetical protein
MFLTFKLSFVEDMLTVLATFKKMGDFLQSPGHPDLMENHSDLSFWPKSRYIRLACFSFII